MNWVGGARSRVRHQNERKLQREFFERKRHTGIGRGGMAKRLCTSSPPMNVQYKKLVSQDLISLRALQETCDDHNIIGNEAKNDNSKVPQKITLPSHNPPSNFNLDLSTSPISQPSMLDLGTDRGVSFYDDRPKVSTGKFPLAIDNPLAKKQRQDWSFNTTLEKGEEAAADSLLTESIFHSHSSKPLPAPQLAESHVQTDTESIFYRQQSSMKHLAQTSSLSDNTLLTESIFHSHKPNPKGKKSSFEWEGINWYKQKPAQQEVQLRHGITHHRSNNNPAHHQVHTKRKSSVYDRETPFSTIQQKSLVSLIDFHKTEQKRQTQAHKPNDIRARKPNVLAKTLYPRSPVLSDEDPVGISPDDAVTEKKSFIVTSASSPAQQLLCSETLSQISSESFTENNTNTNLPPAVPAHTSSAAFESMISSFEKPPSEDTSCQRLGFMASIEKTPQNNQWMNFTADTGKDCNLLNKELKVSANDLNSSPTELCSDEDKIGIPDQDVILSPEDLSESGESSSKEKSTAVDDCLIEFSSSPEQETDNLQSVGPPHQATALETDDSKSSTRYLEMHTQTDPVTLNSSETQTDLVTFRALETQTDPVISKSLGTQTDMDVVLKSSSTQTDSMILKTSETQTEVFTPLKDEERAMPLVRDILNELKMSYTTISSSMSSNETVVLPSLLAELESLGKRINAKKDDIVWCKVMLELKHEQQ